ncbi:hypothetical protein KPH14_007960 [Odynerus spinipes]|uniref:Uncharacterized protein n=1 Tax=Odynerus spinipes TaxID=1348599 RepID=A0AAD9RL52_9HYME|nr:hypothetical protein KPH14_007960 [Odynerus spinipes]
MRRFTLILSFLALASNPSSGLQWSNLLWIGGRQTEVEKPEVVEVIRWSQPVCVVPAKGVKSCLRGLSDLQKEYERVSGKEFEEEQKKIDEIEQSKLYDDVLRDSPDLRSTYELFEQLRPSEEDLVFREDGDNPIAKRTVQLPEKVVEENPREAKFLITPSEKPNLIYVTKVLKAPVTATLVALNCVPDIGIPLCEDDRSLKNVKFSEDESKEEEIDTAKLLETLAKQQSVVDVIRQMMEKPGESRNTVEQAAAVEASETLNLNINEDSKPLEGLELTEILLEKDNGDSDDPNREKRSAKPIVFDKYNYIFSKPASNDSIIINDPVYVIGNPSQHPWWESIQKHYNNAFKKPIYVYQKPFNHTSILEWLFPKKPIAKLDFFQNIFQYINKKKFPSSNNDPVPLTNEESESQISSEKPMNSEVTMTTAAGDRPNPKPVDDTTTRPRNNSFGVNHST